jgi:hypothetical protein
MKRLLLAVAALTSAAVPAVVFAAQTTTSATTTTPKMLGGTVVLGQTKTAIIPPICPTGFTGNNCKIVLTRSTALETLRDGTAYPTTVKAPGTIVAFTLGVAKLSTSAAVTRSEIHNLDVQFGGNTEAAITVLRPAKGKNNSHVWTVVSESPLVHLQPYIGYVVQFSLATPLAVQRGDAIGLTVPTWAPVLSFHLSKKFAYRQSRKANCNNPGAAQNAQLRAGNSAAYGCDYPGTRVEYSATEVLTTPTPKNYVHSPDLGSGK